MQNNKLQILRETLIAYAKELDERSGKILEAINHIDEASNILASLPQDVQNDIEKIIAPVLLAGGISLFNNHG